MHGTSGPASAKAPARLAVALRAKAACGDHRNWDRAPAPCTRRGPAGPGRSRRSETARTPQPGIRTGGSPETRARRMAAGRRRRGNGPPGLGRSRNDPARSGEERCRQDDAVRSSWTAGPSGPNSGRHADVTTPRQSKETGQACRQTSLLLRGVKRARMADSAIRRPPLFAASDPLQREPGLTFSTEQEWIVGRGRDRNRWGVAA
jgi:hypothetical protein